MKKSNVKKNDLVNLRKLNGALGFMSYAINSEYDEEDAKLLDEFMSMKVKDFSKWCIEELSKMDATMPDEAKELTFGELLDMISKEIDLFA